MTSSPDGGEFLHRSHSYGGPGDRVIPWDNQQDRNNGTAATVDNDDVSSIRTQQTQRSRNYGAITDQDCRPINNLETSNTLNGLYGDSDTERGQRSPRAQSVPVGSTNQGSVAGRSQDGNDYGFMPGMNVEITQSDHDMTTQNLPEGLRHVMLHVIGSRPSEEVKFRRMKYRLETGDSLTSSDSATTFMPRGRKVHRPPKSVGRGAPARRQQSWQSGATGSGSGRVPLIREISEPILGQSHGSDDFEANRQWDYLGPEASPHPNPDEVAVIQTPTTSVLRDTTRRQKGVLIVLALNELMASMSLSILAPFFPMEARRKGLSDAISGWVFGVFALVQCLTSPIFGRVLPRVGAKFLAQSGQFFAGGCTVLFGMLQYVSSEDHSFLFITYCFVLRMFMAVGCAANGTAAFAIAARTFPDNPATVFGLLETAVGFGLMLGPALGGVLYEVGGFVMPFAVIGSAMVLIVPVGLFVLPSDIIEEKRDASTESTVFDFLRIPAVSLTAGAAFIACLAWVMPDPTLEPHLSQFNLSPTIVGMVFLLMSACYAICSPVWGWVADNVPDSSPMMVVGFTGTGVGFLILGPSPIFQLPKDFSPLWLNVIALIVIGLSISLALVPTYDKILDAAEKAGISDTLANCSTVAGIWNSAYCFGEFVGPVVAGWMMGNVGFAWTMSLASGLCFLMAIAMLILYLYESKFGPTGVKSSGPDPSIGQVNERTPLLDPAQSSS